MGNIHLISNNFHRNICHEKINTGYVTFSTEFNSVKTCSITCNIDTKYVQSTSIKISLMEKYLGIETVELKSLDYKSLYEIKFISNEPHTELNTHSR